MGPLDDMRNSVELAFAVAEMALAIWLFSGGFERRDRPRRAMLLAMALVIVGWALVSVLVFGIAGRSASGDPLALVLSTTAFWLLPILVGATLVASLREARLWAALYCAAAGYILQNLASGAADAIELVAGSGDVSNVPLGLTLFIELATCIAVYLPGWRLLAKPVRRHGLASSSDRGVLMLLVAALLAVILFDVVNKELANGLAPLSLVLTLKLVHGIVCVSLLAMGLDFLVSRRAREDAAVAERMLATARRQYQLSRENIEAINIKCHDIKHQIRHLAGGGATVSQEVLDAISDDVDIYDTQLMTGNDALDTILTEKGLICHHQGISLRCIADGTSISFMHPVDIYALFGNILDNAIEASMALDPGSRDISLVVKETAGAVSIHAENRFSGTVTLGNDGLPVTSKDDPSSHGYGTKSMRQIAERYGGSMAIRTVQDTFHVNIVLPLPE